MSDSEILARTYTDDELHRLLLDMFAHVPASRTPFFVRLLRRKAKHPTNANRIRSRG